MSADDHLHPDQFLDVYHATDASGAQHITSGRYHGRVYVSTHESPYLAEYGSERVKMRVPVNALKPDIMESPERRHHPELFVEGERHYHLPGDEAAKYVVH